MACLLVVAVCCGSVVPGSEAAADDTLSSLFETANWQAPIAVPMTDPAVTPDVVMPIPPQDPTVLPPTPLLDSTTPTEEELVPPFGTEEAASQRRGVKPYGGGHPTDWPWGCGGSPFRTGPGACDDWDVGCRWDVAVDGMVMMREDANLAGIAATEFMPGVTAPPPPGPYLTDQFDYEPGGRVSFISKFPHYTWQMHAGYEGIEEWNASVVFPKISPFLDPDGPGGIVVPANSFEQRSIHYRSSFHSGELNFVRDDCSRVWRPYCGVRYVKFDDEINDTIDQQIPMPPLPTPGASIQTLEQDRFNIFDVENNLIGFQVGLRHDLWRPMRRLSVEGFVNAGVYYNRIKYTNLMGVFSTSEFSDNPLTAVNEARTDFSDVVNNDVSELSEISYIAEASLSGVCRLNKCWALRAGYQALWITDLHVAEDAFLNGSIDVGMQSRDLFFHGWHAGVEHRR